MTLSWNSKILTNSFLFDKFQLGQSYQVPKLTRLVFFWRPKLQDEFIFYFDQYLCFLIIFNFGLITKVFTKKKIYKSSEMTLESNFSGIHSMTSWDLKKKFPKSFLDSSWFLLHVKKLLLLKSRLDSLWFLRRSKYLEYFCFSFTFPLLFSLYRRFAGSIFFFRHMPINLFKFTLTLGFSSGFLLLNFFFLSFYHFPFTFFKRKKRKESLKRKRKNKI